MQSSTFVGSVRPFQRAAVAPRVVAARPSRVAVPVIENRVAIRFQRFGRKQLPFYRLVAIDSKDRRDGKPLEYLGCASRGLLVWLRFAKPGRPPRPGQRPWRRGCAQVV